ncbi:amino acid kinase family protein [Methylobacterium iners]|uniref:Aspartate/glutamate/uridylate kinase domain-containing protein n=1 Tax=Methylobacterium iners TaxID=418707 RepID=A0ABQ4S4S3_9HYPH|nr:uridylate kinase [Methylobacterium iners]GJD97402.1 hypothetical protein OCOJLMKI_4632 [Methylobacterium iners]
MKRDLSVVKVGGSLTADEGRLRAILGGLAGSDDVIVPGGGAFADAVRADQAALGYDDARAHRLALDAMTRMGERFLRLEPRLLSARSVAACALPGRTRVWDPAALKAGHPEIPESWDVTSDSLALWLATELGAARCLLLKSVDAPSGAGPAELSRLGLVDAAFPGFAARFRGEIVIRSPDRCKAAA